MTDHRVLTTILSPLLDRRKQTRFAVPGAIRAGARILAIDTGDLAEMLFFVPLLAGIRRRYSDTSVDFLLPESHAPLVVASGLARQCLVYKPKQLKPWRLSYASLLRGLGKPGYDVAVLMTMESHAELELASLASGAGLRLGPSHRRVYPAVNCELRALAQGERYRGDRLASMAPFLGLAAEDFDPAWPLPEERLRQSARLVHFNKPDRGELLVGVDPGLGKSGRGIAQQKMLFVTQQIATQLRCRFLALSDPDNQRLAREFAGRLSHVVTGLVPGTLLDSVLLLAQCDLFIAGNTDLFHFAVALGVPTVGLFTPHDGEEWNPGARGRCRVVRISFGERVDIATLMEAVTAARGEDATPAAGSPRVESVAAGISAPGEASDAVRSAPPASTAPAPTSEASPPPHHD